MATAMGYLNPLLFAALPYVAAFTFFLMTIQRYRQRAFTYSSLSSQFLENKQHFWAMVPFHYGIIAVLGAHIGALLLPGALLAWNSQPLRLYALEVTGLALGVMTLVGLVSLVVRRMGTNKVRVITTPMDWLVYVLLVVQVASGVSIALFYPWGSSWYAAAAVPYLRSLLELHPEIQFIVGMPWLAQVHIVNAFLLIGVFPFTRLVHILVAPNPYLWRKPQVVRWYRARPDRAGD